MANKQVTVTLVGDSDQFIKSMGKASDATKKLEGSTETLAHKVGDARNQIKGTSTLLDGLSEVFGGNVEAATETLHGYAQLAKGIKTGLIPAVEATIVKMKALSASMTATPWGRFAFGAGLAVTALVAITASTENGRSALGKLADVAKERVNTQFEQMGKVASFADAHVGGLGSKLLNLIPGFKSVDEAAAASTARLAVWTAQAAAAAKAIAIANQLGGTVDDPDGAFASAAAVAQMNNVMGGPIISAVEKSAKPKVKKAAKSLGDTFADEFRSALAKRSPLQVLEGALSKWQAKLQKAKDFQKSQKSLFELAFSGERDQFGSSVGGLRDQVKRFEKFIKLVGDLRRKGLRESFLRPMIDAGPSSLEALEVINSSSVKDMNVLIDRAKDLAGGFSADETARRGMDLHPKPVKVTLDVKGGDKELVNLIKKWVRTNGGGDVQVAFGKR